MTQPDPKPVPMPVYLRVGEGEEFCVAMVMATSLREAVTGIVEALQDAAGAIVNAAQAEQSDFGLAPPSPSDESPELSKGTLRDLSNQAARDHWPSPPPTPGG